MIDLGGDEFTDLTEIGQGGFGVVFTARQPSFDRTVAIKVLTLADAGTLRRFDRERQALGKVSNHPHITPVFASGFTTDGMPYLAMELMRGGSLADRLEQSGAMPWQEVLDLGIKLSGALETAHRAGILHRDLKPANILLSDFGEPTLADFGIASVEDAEQTKTGVITASVAFAAPEVLDGKRPGVAADVYGLGATLFTLLAGTPPFSVAGEESVLAVVLRVARDPVPDLRPRGVPDAFAAVLEASMAKSADQRPASAGAIGRELRAVQASLGLPQTPMVLRSEERTSGTDSETTQLTVGRTAGSDGGGGAWPTPPVTAMPQATPSPPAAQPNDQLPGPVGSASGFSGPPGLGAPVTSDGSGESAPRRGGLIALGGAALVAIGITVAIATTGGDPPAEDPAASASPAAPVVPAPTASAADLAEGTDANTSPPGPLMPGDWLSVRPMPVARQQIPAVSLRGTVWVAGGLTEDGVTSSVEGFEPASNSWRTAPDLPIPLHHHMSAVYDDELVVLGGWSPEGALLSAITSDRVFALRDGAWVELPPMLQPRVAGAAAAVGDVLVVTGGQEADGQLLESTEVFDGQAWREVAPLPTPREHLAAASDGTALFVIGGRNLSADNNIATLERYDPASDQWESLPEMPTARGGLGAAIHDGVLVAVGGERPLGVFDAVEAYDIDDQEWTVWPSLPTPRHGLGVAMSSSSLVAIGGALQATHSLPTSVAEAVALR